MGASNRQSGRAYYTVSEGKFTRRVPAGFVDEAGQTAVPRVLAKGPNAGKTIHEVKYGNFDGVITNVQIKESDFGTDIEIYFDEDDVVQIKESSQAGKAFLKMFPNIDLSKPIDVALSQEDATINGETVKVTSLFVRQDGKLVPYAHTKAVPNGMPAAEVVTVNKKPTNDYSKQLTFLWSAVIKKFPSGPKVEPKAAYPVGKNDGSGIPF